MLLFVNADFFISMMELLNYHFLRLRDKNNNYKKWKFAKTAKFPNILSAVINRFLLPETSNN